MLFKWKCDVEPDGSAASFEGATVGCFHDSRWQAAACFVDSFHAVGPHDLYGQCLGAAIERALDEASFRRGERMFSQLGG